MNKMNHIIGLLLLVAGCLSSCELTNELEGKYKLKSDEGLLNLNLVPKVAQTKAGADADMDVNTFKVDIVDVATGGVVRTYESYEKLKMALPIIVPVGSYQIVAKSGELQEASRIPYFEGNTKIDVKQGVESKADVTCKLATVKVALNISEDFLNTFDDDYSITITNDAGGAIQFTKEDVSSVYLKIPDGAVSIKIAAKVTDKVTKRDIETSYTVTKPEGEELAGGDAFNVVIKPTEEDGDGDPEVPGEPAKPTLGLKLDIDLTMDETGITIKVPTELIEESNPEGPETPDTPDTPDTPEVPEVPEADAPQIIGADNVIEVDTNNPPTVQVTMTAPAGIKNLFVTITSESSNFIDLVGQLGLANTFDLVNPGDLEGALGGNMSDGTGIGLIDPSDPVKNKKEFIFDVSGFMPMLAPFGKVQHYFTIKLVDNKGVAVEKKLTVKVVAN